MPFVRPGTPAFPVATLTLDARDRLDERDGPDGGGLVDSQLRALHEQRRASSLPSHVPSELVRYLFRDGGCLIFHCARPTRAF